MAKSSTTFKKGQSGNPKGKPPLPPEIKEITRHTKPAIIEAYWKLSNLSPADFNKYKPETMLEAGIKKCLAAFASQGRVDQVAKIWAECHGKPIESHNISGDIDGTIKIVITNAETSL